MSVDFDYQGLWETPMMSIYKTEKSNSVTIVLTIIGLEMHEGNLKCIQIGAKEPSNASVKQSISDQSFEFKLILKPDGNDKNVRRYKWSVKRLPSRIRVDKTKIKYDNEKVFITFNKTDDTRWEMYREDNFETAN